MAWKFVLLIALALFAGEIANGDPVPAKGKVAAKTVSNPGMVELPTPDPVSAMPLVPILPPEGISVPKATSTALPAPTAFPVTSSVNSDLPSYYGGLEYVLYSVRNSTLPPLLQALPVDVANSILATGATIPPNAARIIYGQNGLDFGTFNGLRLNAGLNFRTTLPMGIDFNYLQLEQRSDGYRMSSPGIPVLGRYYYDPAQQSTPNIFLVRSTPDGAFQSNFQVAAPLTLYTTDINFRIEGYSFIADRTEVLLGVRYLDVRDAVHIRDGYSQRFNGGTALTSISENFATSNQFYGGQIGIASHFSNQNWLFDVTGKLAMGGVSQDVNINARTTQTVNGQVVVDSPTGVLVGTRNAGRSERSAFAVMPELNLKLGYQVTSRFSLNIGYNVFMISNIVRAGGSIDPVVNPMNNPILPQNMNQLPVDRPKVPFNGTDFWAQGLTLGFALSY